MAADKPFNHNDYPEILKPTEVAEWLRLSPRMVQLMAKDGRLPAFEIPGVRGYRFAKADIETWIANTMRPTGQHAPDVVDSFGFGR
jgi:excisionase family DNA binding protein